MNLSDYIHERLFEEKEKYTYLYELLWSNLEEDGYVVTEEDGNEIDCIFKAQALKSLIGEFVYRLYDEVNDSDFEEVIERLDTLGISLEEIVDYCYENPDIDTDDENDEITVKNALDFITQETADKLLELFSADDLFDYFFSATYDFEQDFVFAFEDVDEFQAFVDSNTERLDEYKEEYPSVLRWIEGGMAV
jgi:DNA-binding transcriptional MerR regulator